MRSGRQNRSGSRTSRQDALTASTLSTPPRSTDLPTSELSGGGGGLAAPVAADYDNISAASRPPLANGTDAQPSGPAHPTERTRAPARMRRNPWQTMREHLVGGGREPRSTVIEQAQEAEGASDPEPVSVRGSQAPRGRAPVSREGALRPRGSPSPRPGDTVPSLLLRLSDPVPAASAALPHTARGNAPGADAGPRRETVSAPSSRGARTPEDASRVARTRAANAGRNVASRGDEQEEEAASAPPAVELTLASVQPPGAAPPRYGERGPAVQHADERGACGAAPRGGVAHPRGSAAHSAAPPPAGRALHIPFWPRSRADPPPLPSPLLRHPRTADAPAAATGEPDPRFLLVQKLGLEKRRAAAAAPTAPTAENAPAGADTRRCGSPPARAAATPPPASALGPPALLSGRNTHGSGSRPTPAALRSDAVAAERREAALRGQALLRVRLAAAKRAALSGEAGGRPGTPGEKGPTAPASEKADVDAVDDRRVTRDLEDTLRSRLRARKAG